MMMGENKDGAMMCKCPHHKVVPLMITLIGVVFLLGNMGTMSMQTVGIVWPVLVIVIGVMKLMKGACKCCMNG